MRYHLGKLDPVPGAVSWAYSEIFDRTKLMQPPLVFGHVLNTTVIPILGNSKCGDCVWATMAHLQNNMQRGVGGDAAVTPFSEKSVIGDYSAETGYNGSKESDKGTLMSDGASYWRKTGIADEAGRRHQVSAYVSMRIHDIGELYQAAFDFGGIALGVQLPQSAMDQFTNRQPWSRVANSPILGGHAIALVGRNSHGHAVIETWDGLTAATPEWLLDYADESLAFLNLSYLDARGINPRGYDRAQLEAKLAGLA